MDSGEKCWECYYYEGDRTEGICHRYPPRFLGMNDWAKFPKVEPESWCGEFRKFTDTDYEKQTEDEDRTG
jgi:hypothetical protein